MVTNIYKEEKYTIILFLGYDPRILGGREALPGEENQHYHVKNVPTLN